MNLQELQERRASLDTAIANGTQGVYMLQGHKAEVEFQIQELMKESCAGAPEPLANPEESPVE